MKTILSIFALLIIFSSCKKEPSVSPAEQVQSVIITYVVENLDSVNCEQQIKYLSSYTYDKNLDTIEAVFTDTIVSPGIFVVSFEMPTFHKKWATFYEKDNSYVPVAIKCVSTTNQQMLNSIKVLIEKHKVKNGGGSCMTSEKSISLTRIQIFAED